MTKHTPGPWCLSPNGTYVRRTLHGFNICAMSDVLEETPANARLIAAAPDYDKAALDFLELWPLSGYELEAYCEVTLVPALRAAIAKAEGREP